MANSDEYILRIKQLIKELNVTQNEFADRIETDRSNFSKHLTGKLPINVSLLNKIIVGIGVSKDWIMKGEGDIFYMNELRNHSRLISVTSSAITQYNPKGAKVYDIDVTAGGVNRELAFASENVIGTIDMPYINPESQIVKVSGESMYPVICNGDMIAIREVKNFNQIFWGQIYVVILQDYRMVKYLRKHNNPNMIILRSENKEYDDMEVRKNEILTLFLVENIIRVDSRV